MFEGSVHTSLQVILYSGKCNKSNNGTDLLHIAAQPKPAAKSPIVMAPRKEAPTVPLQEASMVPLQEASTDPLQEASTDPLQEAPMVPLQEAPMVPLQEASMVPLQEAPTAPLQETAGTPVTVPLLEEAATTLEDPAERKHVSRQPKLAAARVASG